MLAPRLAMTNRTILPTRDPRSGFWAAAERNGYEAGPVWQRASCALATMFELTPGEVRDFLDSQAGRLLADDIGFVEGGPANCEAFEALIEARLRHVGWRRLYEQAISGIRTNAGGGARRPAGSSSD